MVKYLYIFERPRYGKRFTMRIPSWSRLGERKKRSVRYLGLAFLIPFLVMTTVFIVQQVHPFGSRMILTVDLYHQYAPFVAELRHKILSGESLFYSWNIGLGTNFWSIFANYAASPLNLLMLFFPDKYVSDGIALLVCLRVGLTGLFFAMLLRDIDGKREDLFLSVFSSFYAFCGWILAYFWNIMWLDAVMLLPLIVLGMRKMIRDRKPLLYVVSLFLCIWSNYYAAYFVCLFLVLYAPACFLTVYDRLDWRRAFSGIWRFAVYSLLAAGLSAILVLPTYLSLRQSSATGDTFPTDWTLTQNMFDFYARFFVGGNPNIREGMANVYSGVLILLLVPLFFLCTRIRLREKLSYGFLLVFLYFSFSSKILNFIWHGFHYPNQIPYREAFLLSFILVIMGYRVLRNLKSFTIQEVSASGILVLIYLVVYKKFVTGGETDLPLYLTAGFVILYVAVMRMILLGRGSIERQRNTLCIAILLEIAVAAHVTIGLVAMHEGFTAWDFYANKADAVTTTVAADEKSGADDFTRAEIYPAFISNETALYHVKGMSVFSSTADESFVQFMKSIGFHNNGINGVRNYGLTPVTATLLGIDYFVDVIGDAAVPTGFTAVENTSDLRVYKNNDALSIGYMVSPDVLDFHTTNQNNPFRTTNLFLRALGVSDTYKMEVMVPGDCQNAQMTAGNGENGYSFSLITDKQEAVIRLRPNAQTIGSHLYLYVQSNKAPTVVFSGQSADTEETYSSTQEARTMQIIDLGLYQPTENQSIELKFPADISGSIVVYCASIDSAAYDQMKTTLSQSMLQVTHYDSTHLSGEIDAQSNGVMLLTMPYDTGWSATVDGKSAEILSIGDALAGISLAEGQHTISMVYRPQGFTYGALISLASLLVLILLFLPTTFAAIRERKRRIAGSPLPASPNRLEGTAEERREFDPVRESDSVNTPPERTARGPETENPPLYHGDEETPDSEDEEE